MSTIQTYRKEIVDKVSCISGQIDSIRIYLKNVEAIKRFSCATWYNRQHFIVAIESRQEIGFAECLWSIDCPNVDLEECHGWLEELVGLSIGQALLWVRQRKGNLPPQFVEMLEIALLDLSGKRMKIPAVRLLGLNGMQPVCGVHVILSDQLNEVEESAKWARSAGKSKYVKVKLFGDTKLDCDIIRTVRKWCPQSETFLIGDVNCGYCPQGTEDAALDDLANVLYELYQSGLNACEDPAFLTNEQWVKLQKLVLPLKLIPDYPLRNSEHAVDTICKGMGKIYNIHPDSAGSVIDAVVLARKIHTLDAELMIGDDSLIGPSASAWQQIAVALHAKWVEATEKRTESDFYYRCVKQMATDSHTNPISIEWKNGFGVVIDEDKMAKETDALIEVKR